MGNGAERRRAGLSFTVLIPADYGSNLEEDIKADTSGYLERILVCLLQVSQPWILGTPGLGDPNHSPLPESGSWPELLGLGEVGASMRYNHWGLGSPASSQHGWEVLIAEPCTSPGSRRRGHIIGQVLTTRPMPGIELTSAQ